MSTLDKKKVRGRFHVAGYCTKLTLGGSDFAALAANKESLKWVVLSVFPTLEYDHKLARPYIVKKSTAKEVAAFQKRAKS